MEGATVVGCVHDTWAVKTKKWGPRWGRLLRPVPFWCTLAGVWIQTFPFLGEWWESHGGCSRLRGWQLGTFGVSTVSLQHLRKVLYWFHVVSEVLVGRVPHVDFSYWPRCGYTLCHRSEHWANAALWLRGCLQQAPWNSELLKDV